MFAALLLFLGAVGTHWSATMASPISTCPSDCTVANKSHHVTFKHLNSGISSTSVAPWTLQTESELGREPQYIRNAVCGPCTVKDMTAEPIYIQIPVYKRHRTSADTEVTCRCPYKLAVGCTCIRKQ